MRNIIQNTPFKWIKYFDKKALEKLVDIIRKEKVDYLLVSAPHMMEYAMNLKKLFPDLKIILREHNIESELVKNFIDLVNNPLLKVIALWQYKKSLKREIFYWNFSDKVCFISDSDYELALKIKPELKNKYEIIHDGFEFEIENKSCDYDYYNREKEEFSFIFSGSVKTLQNKYNLEWFINSIWKRFILSDFGRKYKLYITGNSQLELERIIGLTVNDLEKYNIVNLGFVENINEILKSKMYFVSPTIIGSGIRLKVLHSMSLGLVVFLTEKDYRMVKDFKDMENVVLFSSYDDFVYKLKVLEKSIDLRKRISRNASDLIKNKLNWENYAKKIYDVIMSLEGK
ncbi:MAG: glycosyltransferase [Minisyncoccia bacterium]